MINSISSPSPRSIDHAELVQADISTVRQAIRSGQYSGQTAGLGAGKVQANLMILPAQYALDFMRYCQRNPKPCPLVGVSDTGSPMLLTMGEDIDVRTDIPAYNVYRGGQLNGRVSDLQDLWQQDYVAFALGCSFTFEHAAMRAGLRFWHIKNNKTVPMYRSNIATVAAGSFHGKMAVSMRAVPADQVETVNVLSAQYPHAHGAPIHIGNPAKIGILDLSQPNWGDAMPIQEGHVPMFWACGVTPQIALENAALPLVITHTPGHMLISDLDERMSL